MSSVARNIQTLGIGYATLPVAGERVHYHALDTGASAVSCAWPLGATKVDLEKLSPEEREAFEEDVFALAKEVCCACCIEPVFVPGNPRRKTEASIASLCTEDYMHLYRQIMDLTGVLYGDVPNRKPPTNRSERVMAIVAHFWGLKPSEVKRMPAEEYEELIRWIEYVKEPTGG